MKITMHTYTDRHGPIKMKEEYVEDKGRYKMLLYEEYI